MSPASEKLGVLDDSGGAFLRFFLEFLDPWVPLVPPPAFQVPLCLETASVSFSSREAV